MSSVPADCDEFNRESTPEESVLGALLLGGAWEQAAVLTHQHFLRADHQAIFQAIRALAVAGKPVDHVLVTEQLDATGDLEAAGGHAYLSQLARETPTAANLRAYVEVVLEHHRLRELKRLGTEVEAAIADGATSAEVSASMRSALAQMEPKPQLQPDRRALDWKHLSGFEPPPRDWAITNWLARGHIALVAGDGGLGKTLLAQTAGTCLSLGYEYIETVPQPLRVLFWAGEDEDAELWRRQVAICKWLDVGFDALDGKLIIESYFKREMTLAALAFGKLEVTPLMAELRAQIGDYKADYVFLDSVARVYGGSENDRHQVTQFVSELARACTPTGAGLCLIGHPGKAAGSEYSGSTAWEGSVRSRLYLAHSLPGRDDRDDEPAEDSVRYLSRRKANYSAKDWRKLNYTDGVLVPEVRARQAFARPEGEFGQDIVIRAVRKLAERGMHGNASSNSPDYLPKLAKEYSLLEELDPKRFAGHMRKLIMGGQLQKQTVGQYSNRTPKMGLVEVHK